MSGSPAKISPMLVPPSALKDSPAPIDPPHKTRMRRHTRRVKPLKPILSNPAIPAIASEEGDIKKTIARPKIEPIMPYPRTEVFSTGDIKKLQLQMTEARALRIIRRVIKRAVVQIRLAKDTKRRSIIRELIETERNYVDSLSICHEVYYKPLDRTITSKNPLIDSSTLGQLFGNIDQIRDVHQFGIINVIDEVAPQLRSSFPSHEVYLRIANAFIEIVPKFQQIYPQYLSATENSEAILKKLKKNRKFNQFLQEALFNPRSKCREIEDLLILPTQRIAGYKLLFERVIKYFPIETYPNENKAFKDALDMISEVGATMNAEKSDQTSQMQLLTIAESVNKIPIFMCLLKPGRRYLMQTRAHFVDINDGHLLGAVVMFVMNDILLITTKREKHLFSSNKLTYHDAVPLTQIRFSMFPIDRMIDRAFVMKTDTREYNLYIKPSRKRDEFINKVKSQKKQIVSQVKKQSEDGMEYMQNVFGKLAELYTSERKSRSREEALMSLE
ncbi:RhoGEF domain containing protein [Histomonas meleagridis]|uniref:RhoGEF domain containing protein n=1 Tax=Histomonas meleagridis TaxID=135588 RepID=UPI003559A27C|nr:RhoGEF domain containing protein [Histomonas meleagridis]KAH0800801.1 RhoGEF domain containing protein [Histomonas meleagridis]